MNRMRKCNEVYQLAKVQAYIYIYGCVCVCVSFIQNLEKTLLNVFMISEYTEYLHILKDK